MTRYQPLRQQLILCVLLLVAVLVASHVCHAQSEMTYIPPRIVPHTERARVAMAQAQLEALQRQQQRILLQQLGLQPSATAAAAAAAPKQEVKLDELLNGQIISTLNGIVKQTKTISTPVSLPKPESVKQSQRTVQEQQKHQPKLQAVGMPTMPVGSNHPLQQLGSDKAVDLNVEAAATLSSETTSTSMNILSRIVPKAILKAILPSGAQANSQQPQQQQQQQQQEPPQPQPQAQASINQMAALDLNQNTTDIQSTVASITASPTDQQTCIGTHETQPDTCPLSAAALAHAAAALQKPERTAEELHAGIMCGIPMLATAAAGELERRGLNQLVKSAVHENGLIRLEAAQALGRLADPRATAVLLRLAMTDNYIYARKAAVDALRSVARANEGVGKQITTALNNVLTATPNPNVGWKTANALAAMGDVSVIEYIQKVLDNTEDEWIAWEGLTTLEKLPITESTVETIYPFITHPSTRVAEAALGCMSNLSSMSVLAWRVMQASKKHPIPSVATKAIEACKHSPAKTLPEAMLLVAAHQSARAREQQTKAKDPNTARNRSEL